MGKGEFTRQWLAENHPDAFKELIGDKPSTKPQKCATNELMKPKGEKIGKYRNKKQEIGNITFDSRKEANRYLELKQMQEEGKIINLELQKRYDFILNDVKICGYVADFYYNNPDGSGEIVEDVKSAITKKNRAYRIKHKLMKAFFGIEIKEV